MMTADSQQSLRSKQEPIILSERLLGLNVQCVSGIEPLKSSRWPWTSHSEVTTLQVISKPISKRVHDRFSDLNEICYDKIFQYLNEAKVDAEAILISIKLKTLESLGHGDAQPWVIVLCHEKAFKKVKQFFAQEWVRAQHKSNEDADIPSLRVLVSNRPPLPTALIYGPSLTTSDCPPPGCGTPFRVEVDSKMCFGSIGGIVMVQTREGSMKLYGMSAGHVFESRAGTCSPSNTLDDRFFSSEKIANSGRDYSLEFPVFRSNGENASEGFKSPSSNSSSTWPAIGKTWSSSFSDLDKLPVQNLDWSLISFQDISQYYPIAMGKQRLSSPDENPSTTLREDLLYLTAQRHGERPVEVYCGISGYKRGTLSMVTSYLTMAPAQKFIKTFCLSFSDGTALQDGDCGSWVIDQETRDVYGHVVARDDFGEAYVVPIMASFRDMVDKLDLTSICIPTANEISSLTTPIERKPHSRRRLPKNINPRNIPEVGGPSKLASTKAFRRSANAIVQSLDARSAVQLQGGLASRSPPFMKTAGGSTLGIAIAGSGGLSQYLAYYLQKTAIKFIILSRAAKPDLEALGYQVIVVNYDSQSELRFALQGVDLVISTVCGTPQIDLIHASAYVKARHFVPAEFEGPPSHREADDALNRTRGSRESLELLRHYSSDPRHQMHSTVFTCGIFYERFARGGLASISIGLGSGNEGQGAYLMDIENNTAEILEMDAYGVPIRICMTSIQDVARFVIAALDLGLSTWPAEFRMMGGREWVGDIVSYGEAIKGNEFRTILYETNQLAAHLTQATQEKDWAKIRRMQALIATARRRYDYSLTPKSKSNSKNLNELLDAEPISFWEWLKSEWNVSPGELVSEEHE